MGPYLANQISLGYNIVVEKRLDLKAEIDAYLVGQC
jgi:hypothetical protein